MNATKAVCDTLIGEESTSILHNEHKKNLRQAYIKARREIEVADIELNRSKVMIIDEHGKMKSIAIITEH